MLRDDLKSALKEALKAGDSKKLSTLRLITAALKDRDIAARSKGNNDGINDDELLSMLQTMIKQRQESAKLYREGNRDELADAEEGEIITIRQFLPKQLDDAEVKEAIRTAMAETGAESVKDMGKVMGFLKEKYAGRMDCAAASASVKKLLLG